MNKVIMIGRLVADPEVRYSKDRAIARYRLAVDRQFKQEGQPTADFISCVAFGKSGEFAAKYLKKGMKIAVEGSIQTGSYEKEGKKYYTTDIIIDRHEFVESKAAEYEAAKAREDIPEVGGSRFTEVPDDDGDLPF